MVVFAQHSKVRTRKFAVKFFLSASAFEVEKAAALNAVRAPLLCAYFSESVSTMQSLFWDWCSTRGRSGRLHHIDGQSRPTT